MRQHLLAERQARDVPQNVLVEEQVRVAEELPGVVGMRPPMSVDELDVSLLSIIDDCGFDDVVEEGEAFLDHLQGCVAHVDVGDPGRLQRVQRRARLVAGPAGAIALVDAEAPQGGHLGRVQQ